MINYLIESNFHSTSSPSFGAGWERPNRWVREQHGAKHLFGQDFLVRFSSNGKMNNQTINPQINQF